MCCPVVSQLCGFWNTRDDGKSGSFLGTCKLYESDHFHPYFYWGRQWYCQVMSVSCLRLNGVCVKNLGVESPSRRPGSQLLSSSCHLIYLAEQLPIPVLLPVTHQHYSCWISLRGSQDSLASSFLQQCTANASHRELGVTRYRYLGPPSHFSGMSLPVNASEWPASKTVFKDITRLFRHSSCSHICVKSFAI